MLTVNLMLVVGWFKSKLVLFWASHITTQSFFSNLQFELAFRFRFCLLLSCDPIIQLKLFKSNQSKVVIHHTYPRNQQTESHQQANHFKPCWWRHSEPGHANIETQPNGHMSAPRKESARVCWRHFRRVLPNRYLSCLLKTWWTFRKFSVCGLQCLPDMLIDLKEYCVDILTYFDLVTCIDIFMPSLGQGGDYDVSVVTMLPCWWLFVMLRTFVASHKVATLAGAEFINVVQSLESDEDAVKVASDWSLSMDVLLTEIKAQSHWVCTCWKLFSSRSCFFQFTNTQKFIMILWHPSWPAGENKPLEILALDPCWVGASRWRGCTINCT